MSTRYYIMVATEILKQKRKILKQKRTSENDTHFWNQNSFWNSNSLGL